MTCKKRAKTRKGKLPLFSTPSPITMRECNLGREAGMEQQDVMIQGAEEGGLKL